MLLILVSGLRAQQDAHGHTWKTAKVLDASTAKTYSEATDRTGASTTVSLRDTELLLMSDEFAYVVDDSRQSGRIPLHQGAIGDIRTLATGHHHGCRFIVGDDVKFYQDKANLHVLDADGKQCKTEILRQERLKKPAEASTNRAK
jgi:hypothetical protein